jgi:hypothetical protein
MLTGRLSQGVRPGPSGEYYYVHDVIQGFWVVCNSLEARVYHANGYTVYTYHPPYTIVTEWVDLVTEPLVNSAFANQLELIESTIDDWEEAGDPELREDIKKAQEGKSFPLGSPKNDLLTNNPAKFAALNTPKKGDNHSPPGSGGKGKRSPLTTGEMSLLTVSRIQEGTRRRRRCWIRHHSLKMRTTLTHSSGVRRECIKFRVLTVSDFEL